MQLLERADCLASLHDQMSFAADGAGHCCLVSGEAGIGKSSLVRTFCGQLGNHIHIYQGTCDALFTPRPLGPLYDIAFQSKDQRLQSLFEIPDKAQLFNRFLNELSKTGHPTLIIFEDVHWADEATLDFIKFVARRIADRSCLFVLTCREDEVHARHPLRHVLGQIPADSLTRLRLEPLSKEIVEKLAAEKGYDGSEVYRISHGNPFYVNEILASYSLGIPENIRDSVLSVFQLQNEPMKRLWQILSVNPTGFEISFLTEIDVQFESALEDALVLQILVLKNGLVFFKHELYRRTIEAFLSPLLKLALNRKILDTFIVRFEEHHQTERIVHYAKNANEYERVVKYAPIAARQAAKVGAHIEAAKLFLTAIEYYQGKDRELLIYLYESYAYECYLINQIRDSIIYQKKALSLYREGNDLEKTGNCTRLLSRFWWYDGNSVQAEMYAKMAIDLLEDQPVSAAKAMAFSNMSQLKMLAGEREACLFWGEQAAAFAQELHNDEVLAHAYNNMGAVQTSDPHYRDQGRPLLERSLQISLQNDYHEQAARAYTNIGSSALDTRAYAYARKALDDGILYCEERDLESWAVYMQACRARLLLETGQWKEARQISENWILNTQNAAIARIIALIVLGTIKMRVGEEGALELLSEALEIALVTKEMQRILPAMIALLEYEWITSQSVIEEKDLDVSRTIVQVGSSRLKKTELVYWMLKTGREKIKLPEYFKGFCIENEISSAEAAQIWEKTGCPYEQALFLFEGTEAEKKQSLNMLIELDARRVVEKLKQEMRSSGMTGIPKGVRKSTRDNAAGLTLRELDVLRLLQAGLQNKEIAGRLFISPKTVDHHISTILFKLETNSRVKAVKEAINRGILESV